MDNGAELVELEATGAEEGVPPAQAEEGVPPAQAERLDQTCFGDIEELSVEVEGQPPGQGAAPWAAGGAVLRLEPKPAMLSSLLALANRAGKVMSSVSDVADQLQTIALSYFGNGMPSPLMLCVLGCGITALHCEQVRHASRHARR